MQLTEYKLANTLQQNDGNPKLAPIYFLYGDENFIIKQYTDQILKISQKQGYTEIIRQNIDQQASIEPIQNHLISSSLFSDKQCLIFSLSQFPNDKIANLIIQYAKNPDTNKILIITYKKLTKAQQKSTYFDAINKTGITVAIWPPQAHNMPTWIQNQAKRYNLTLDSSAIKSILESTENNLFATDQLLKKLSCQDKTHITQADINPISHNQNQHNVFDLIDNALAGNLQKTKKIFVNLKALKTEAHFIIWSAIKSLRVLCQIHQGLKTSKIESLYQKHQIWPKRQKIIYAAINRLDYPKCLRLIRYAYEIELTTKGADDLLFIDGWSALENYILAIAGMDESYLNNAKIKNIR